MDASHCERSYLKPAPDRVAAGGSIRRVAALGVNLHARNALSLLFATRGNGRYRLVDGEHGDIVLVDIDGFDGLDHWEQRRLGSPQPPVVFLSIKVEHAQRGHFLAKPLRPDALMGLLDRLVHAPAADLDPATSASFREPESTGNTPLALGSVNGSGSRARSERTRRNGGSALEPARRLEEETLRSFIGTAPDIDPADPEQIAWAQFDPERFLLGKILRALRTASANQQPVRLVSDRFRGAICLSAQESTIGLTTEIRHIRTLAALPVGRDDLRLELLDSNRYAPSRCDSIYSMERFLWELALWTSRGRVPKGTDLNAKVALRSWPNMSRLQLFPHALRIAALWVNQPMSPLETAARLAVPQRFVFAFYTAAHALDLIDVVTSPASSASPATNTLIGVAKRGLLRKILDHLQGPKLGKLGLAR